jgi:hypothetical protein
VRSRSATAIGIEILDQIVVDYEGQRTQREAAGYRTNAALAIEAYKAQQTEYAELAAEREYEKRHGMSERARGEVETHEDASGEHLPTIPETPIRKRVLKAQ